MKQTLFFSSTAKIFRRQRCGPNFLLTLICWINNGCQAVLSCFVFFLPFDAFKRTKKILPNNFTPWVQHQRHHSLSSTRPPQPSPQPRAVALGEHPQFTAIRFTHHPNSYDLIWFNACFIQLLYNTGPPHYPASPPPSLSWPNLHPPPPPPPPISSLSPTPPLYLTGAFAAVLEINCRGTVGEAPRVESSRMLECLLQRLFHSGSPADVWDPPSLSLCL